MCKALRHSVSERDTLVRRLRRGMLAYQDDDHARRALVKWIVTGGAGFIGCNVVKRLMQLSHEVVVLDDLSRRGTEENLAWLRAQGKLASSRPTSATPPPCAT